MIDFLLLKNFSLTARLVFLEGDMTAGLLSSLRLDRSEKNPFIQVEHWRLPGSRILAREFTNAGSQNWAHGDRSGTLAKEPRNGTGSGKLTPAVRNPDRAA